jgi:hypothetical protein
LICVVGPGAKPRTVVVKVVGSLIEQTVTGDGLVTPFRPKPQRSPKELADHIRAGLKQAVTDNGWTIAQLVKFVMTAREQPDEELAATKRAVAATLSQWKKDPRYSTNVIHQDSRWQWYEGIREVRKYDRRGTKHIHEDRAEGS